MKAEPHEIDLKNKILLIVYFIKVDREIPREMPLPPDTADVHTAAVDRLNYM